MEVYDEEEEQWKSLTSFGQLVHASKELPALVRIPELFQEDAEFDDEEGEGDDGEGDYSIIEATISELQGVLAREKGWSMADEQDGMAKLVEQTDSGPERSVSPADIRAFVLTRAKEDEELRYLLLSHPGCLEHFVQALQFAFVWVGEDAEAGAPNDTDGRDR